MFGALGLHTPLSHVPAAPDLSAGQGLFASHATVQTWNPAVAKFWQITLVQSCSSRHRS